MVLGKKIRLFVLGWGLVGAIAAATGQAADKPTPAQTKPAAKPSAGPASRPAETGTGNPAAFLDRFKRIVDDLKLDEDLQKKADVLIASARKEVKALEKQADAAEVRRKAHDTFEKLRKDMSELLSDEQKQQIQKKLSTLSTAVMIDKIKAKLRELKLTDEQRKNAEAVLDETMHKLEELSAEAHAGAKDIPAKIRDVLKDMHDQLEKILPSEKPKAPVPDAPAK